MAMELKQSLKLSQQLIMTPQLQQTIKLLQLSRLELIDTIHEEMETNPLLDESGPEMDPGSEDGSKQPSEDQPAGDLTQAMESPFLPESPPGMDTPDQHEQQTGESFDWEAYNDSFSHKAPYEFEASEAPSFENFLSKEEDLSDHLLWQLRLSDISDDQMIIGAEIIGNLNEDGYLTSTVEEIAAEVEQTVEEVERVLGVIQEFDPPGVAARNVRECLLNQMRILEIHNPIAEKAVAEYLDLLENKNYALLSKKLHCSLDDIHSALGVITHLEPRPGRLYQTEPPRYITPDIYIHKVEDGFVITQNEDGLPKLKVNSLYREALSGSQAVAPDAKQYIQEKLRSAMWLIKSIHQRQRTIYKVAESILKFQREFFEHGIEHLRPLILKDVAEDISMHESTISRVTSNKYAHTPQGIFNLKFFFNSAIGRSDGDSMASESVKAKIRQVIQGEDPGKPFSDNKIVELLEKEGINIARRTVAKYREAMGILPSSKRKDPFAKTGKESGKKRTA